MINSSFDDGDSNTSSWPFIGPLTAFEDFILGWAYIGFT